MVYLILYIPPVTLGEMLSFSAKSNYIGELSAECLLIISDGKQLRGGWSLLKWSRNMVVVGEPVAGQMWKYKAIIRYKGYVVVGGAINLFSTLYIYIYYSLLIGYCI